MSAAKQPGAGGDALATGQACGKVILLGEHFVVHNAPAIAIPLTAVGTQVQIHTAPELDRPLLDTPLEADRRAQSQELLELACQALELGDRPWRVSVRSDLPIRCGLGSSAAFAVALVQALVRAGGVNLSLAAQRARVRELERQVHGTPSGIDDTVIAHRRPVWFVKGLPPRFLPWGSGLRCLLANSGAPGATGAAVAAVAELGRSDPEGLAALTGRSAKLSQRGLTALLAGDPQWLGALMNDNHALLQQLGVSTPGLDRLVQAARDAGAHGAKLTGSGGGGFTVALVDPQRRESTTRALLEAGATQVLQVVF